MVESLCIVGVGLLGGSIALAARERGLVKRIVGISRQQETLDTSIKRGMLDEGYLDITEALDTVDLAIICTPVDRIGGLALELLKRFPKLVVSDVGSTKQSIMDAVNQHPELAKRFVGGHPLAGSEKSGPEHAMADLFQDRLMFITPSDTSSSGSVEVVSQFWQALGSTTVEVDASEHDATMAMTSHLPHIASFALAGAMSYDYLQYSGTGLRSMCRLAGGDAAMWTAIALHNRTHLLAGIAEMQASLQSFTEALQTGDAATLHTLFEKGRRIHHALGS
jgi:prephenate dehydrogenase